MEKKPKEVGGNAPLTVLESCSNCHELRGILIQNCQALQALRGNLKSKISNREMGTRKAKKVILFFVLTVMTGILVGLSRTLGVSVMALPPPEDTPEEILRTEIITEARSPINGKPLSAAEYAELQAQLQVGPTPKLDPRIRQNIFLLRVLKSLRLLFPFLK